MRGRGQVKAKSTPLGPGTTVVVTGAAGGLGQALCRVLGERGCQVVATDAPGVEPALRTLDVTDAAACRTLAEECRPQLWINNAGVLGAGQALSQDDALVRRLLEVNLMGVINGTRAAAGGMVGRGGGTVLNIGSLSSWNPTPGLAVYAAAKHGVRAYSAALSAELAGTGVRVLCLCPDGIWTPMLRQVVSMDVAAMPFSGGRLLEADEVASAALALVEGRRYLASLPPARAVLAKASGLWPALGVWTRSASERQGRRHQAKYRQRLLSEGATGQPQGPSPDAGPRQEDRP